MSIEGFSIRRCQVNSFLSFWFKKIHEPAKNPFYLVLLTQFILDKCALALGKVRLGSTEVELILSRNLSDMLGVGEQTAGGATRLLTPFGNQRKAAPSVNLKEEETKGFLTPGHSKLTICSILN